MPLQGERKDMSVNQRVLDEITKMLRMSIKELRNYEGGQRSIPIGWSGEFHGEPFHVDDDGIILPTREFSQFLAQQPETELVEAIIYPLDPQRWYNAGVAFVREEMFEIARDCFHRATELKPNFGDAWYNFGEVSFGKLGDRNNGRLGYTKAIECNPQDGDAVYNLGLVEFGEKNWEATEKRFRRAMTLRRDQGQANYWLCVTLFFAGKMDELEKARRSLSENFPLVSIKFEKELQNMLSGKPPEGPLEYWPEEID